MDILIALYLACAAWLAAYGLNCHVLTLAFRRTATRRRREVRDLTLAFYKGTDPVADPDAAMAAATARLPMVTTQIPLYNEATVAERVIEAAAAMRYPQGLHQIQVLDDSDDETSALVAAKVAALAARGVHIEHIRRRDRRGYKAGALANGLATAKGGLAAVFDADFVPPPHFLLCAVPVFAVEPGTGFVQARWGHLNRNETLVTRLESLGIDGHFAVEQAARDGAGWLLNFNGTAGVFSVPAIRAAGGWQSDTLTEDLDLSYRILLAGYSRRYLFDLVVPAELPEDVNAFKSQQFRWAKGSIQTAKKLLPRILAADLPAAAKIQAALHLTHYLIHPLMLALALCSLPVIAAGGIRVAPALLPLAAAAILAGLSGPSTMYLAAGRALGRPVMRLAPLLPLMVVFGCGLAVNNTRAVFEALAGKASAFVRTPKRGQRAKRYRSNASLAPTLAEAAAGAWCLAGAVLYAGGEQWLAGYFLAVYAAGFSFMAALSLLHGARA